LISKNQTLHIDEKCVLFFDLSYVALEEALSNAVYHRAYDEREPIEVRVENDRIEIVSFPGHDRFVTLEGLKSYRVSNCRYRNRHSFCGY
jgi:ATP-dependent DNA helicase RecG